MNDNAKRWVEALRSGEYRQTREVLRDEHGFCCLGVACDLYAKEHPDISQWYEHSYDRGFDFDDLLGTLPTHVRDWLGLNYDDGRYATGSLTEDNDDGKTFAEIADIIESEPDLLFRS